MPILNYLNCRLYLFKKKRPKGTFLGDWLKFIKLFFIIFKVFFNFPPRNDPYGRFFDPTHIRGIFSEKTRIDSDKRFFLHLNLDRFFFDIR